MIYGSVNLLCLHAFEIHTMRRRLEIIFESRTMIFDSTLIEYNKLGFVNAVA